jgi:hypothetical protein
MYRSPIERLASNSPFVNSKLEKDAPVVPQAFETLQRADYAILRILCCLIPPSKAKNSLDKRWEVPSRHSVPEKHEGRLGGIFTCALGSDPDYFARWRSLDRGGINLSWTSGVD